MAMSADYIVLAVIAVLAIGGGLYLLSEAKKYQARHDKEAIKKGNYSGTT